MKAVAKALSALLKVDRPICPDDDEQVDDALDAALAAVIGISGEPRPCFHDLSTFVPRALNEQDSRLLQAFE